MNEPPPLQNLEFDRIGGRLWRYFHESGAIATEVLEFLPDGTLRGYNHDNERYWKIEDGILSFLNIHSVTSVVFETIEFDGGGLLLKGQHIPDPAIVLCLKEAQGRTRNSLTKMALSQEIESLGWSVGEHTYGVPNFYEKGMAKFVIGSYCSIAGQVNIALGNHRTDTFTTYPFREFYKYWQNVPLNVSDHSSKGDVMIGSDVWIGEGVFIGSGVNIGHGSVLAAKAVVVKDVPPYAIVVGNPGRVARYRFDPPTVETLIRLSWWSLSDEIVDRLLPLLMSNDIQSLLQALESANS